MFSVKVFPHQVWKRDAALARVQELGGAKHAGPIDIQMAKIAIVADPQGAIFALYAGALEP